MRRRLPWLLALLVSAPPGAAQAQVAATAPTTAPAPAAPTAPTPPRDLPNYDGRGGEPATLGDALLWVPRVIFFPVYLVTEYLLRKPLGWLITKAEREDWPRFIADLFTFDAEHKTGIVPTAFFDFGLRPSVGLYFFWDDFLAKGNGLRLYGATWGRDWIAASVADRISLGAPESAATFHVSYTRRRDWVFHGLGPRTLESDRSRYSSDVVDVGGLVDYRLARATYFHAAIGVREAHFRSPNEYLDEDPPIAHMVAAGTFPLPPGFRDGYTAFYQRMQLSMDTREKWPASGSGVRVAVEGSPAFDLERHAGTTSARSWMQYGASVGGYLDLTGTRRVLGLVVHTSFADPLSTGDVPFTEQVALGGMGLMRGYRPGRLVGRSAAVATLEYHWPIWMWLDGSLQASVGNVFGEHLAGFDPKLLRLSTGMGLRTSNSPDHQFEVLVGGGTETFEQGGRVTSFRLVIGGTRGF